MGIVADFVQSGDLGWNITREEFLVKVMDEIDNFENVVCAVTKDTVFLYRREYVKVKVVNPTDNGNPTGSA
jgi:hypothetical protein